MADPRMEELSVGDRLYNAYDAAAGQDTDSTIGVLAKAPGRAMRQWMSDRAYNKSKEAAYRKMKQPKGAVSGTFGGNS